MHRVRRWIAAPLAALVAAGLAVGAGAAPAGAGFVADCSGPSGPTGPDQQLRTYVCNLYVRLLERQQLPSDGEISFWVDQIKATSRARVVSAFEHSDENYGLLVTDDYLDFLGRMPDAGGRQHWVDVLRRGVPLEIVDASILSSDEGFQNQGGTDDDYVDTLYSAFLDRVPNDDEIAFWSNQISSHGDGVQARFDVTLQIDLSEEGRGLTAGSLYDYWLSRPADSGGRAFWAGRIAQLGILDVEASFVAQDEVFAAQSQGPD